MWLGRRVLAALRYPGHPAATSPNTSKEQLDERTKLLPADLLPQADHGSSAWGSRVLGHRDHDGPLLSFDRR